MLRALRVQGAPRAGCSGAMRSTCCTCGRRRTSAGGSSSTTRLVRNKSPSPAVLLHHSTQRLMGAAALSTTALPIRHENAACGASATCRCAWGRPGPCGSHPRHVRGSHAAFTRRFLPTAATRLSRGFRAAFSSHGCYAVHSFAATRLDGAPPTARIGRRRRRDVSCGAAADGPTRPIQRASVHTSSRRRGPALPAMPSRRGAAMRNL